MISLSPPLSICSDATDLYMILLLKVWRTPNSDKQRYNFVYYASLSIFQTSKSVGEIKTPIAALCGVPRHCVEIVDMEEGIIYDDCRDVTTLSRPLQVMVGTDERRVPFYLLTTDADMIDQDPDDEEPRLKMSCGHAISQCSCI